MFEIKRCRVSNDCSVHDSLYLVVSWLRFQVFRIEEFFSS